jgi:uncharacterized damage-inducible protein DinB
MLQHFRMFAAYNAWANQRVYEAAADLTDEEFGRDVGVFFRSVMGTLNHILAGDRVWMKRFTGAGNAPTSLDFITSTDLAVLRAERESEDRRIVAWVDGLTPEVLEKSFTYTTITSPATVTQRLSLAMDHFFNHQTHHRGQAHSALTILGKPSLTLDLVAFQRSEGAREFA